MENEGYEGHAPIRHRLIQVPARYYRQFGAEPTWDAPARGFGGWAQKTLPLNLDSTALVVMHAWEAPPASESPQWYSAAEFLDRADAIARTTVAPLVRAARSADLPVIHVVAAPGDYIVDGVSIPVPDAAPTNQVLRDATHIELTEHHRDFAHPGRDNIAEVDRRLARPAISRWVQPAAGEHIAYSSAALVDHLRDTGINHLLYSGFTINICLQNSPGGMVDLRRAGAICSVVADAVTAVENAETIANETSKAVTIWLVSVYGGYVYDSDDLIWSLENR